ncbi:MAG TPA: hypothetical protein DGT21_16290 [Armatimonadetes bacterium]|nr:hypothetical protein [Armatimonadota bacterium]
MLLGQHLGQLGLECALTRGDRSAHRLHVLGFHRLLDCVVARLEFRGEDGVEKLDLLVSATELE